MQSLMPTEQDTAATTLSQALEQVADLDRQIDEVEATLKSLKQRREAVAKVAAEEMMSERLDGVRVAGRSWRVEWEHSCSATGEHRDAIIAAAREIGKGDTLLTVNTSALKSLLKDLAQQAGRPADQPWSEGTPFAGLVSEYVRPSLKFVTVQK